jgi:predicted signal transduction protein with EAL and GGDEF domain
MESLDIELENARENDTNLALLFIDLDGFKQINDTLRILTGTKITKKSRILLL